MVKDDSRQYDNLVSIVSNAVKYIMSYGKRISVYRIRRLCQQESMKFRKLPLDIETRQNATYKI